MAKVFLWQADFILSEEAVDFWVISQDPSADTGSIAILDKKVILAVLPGPYSM